jgi:hypothetical protein
MLIIIALVALCYCGGKLCPAVLRQNKEMLLGVAIGMALCSFMDLRMEGITGSQLGEWQPPRPATPIVTRARSAATGLPPVRVNVPGDTEEMLRTRPAYQVQDPYVGEPLRPIGVH